ncbi:hypothetical protein [Paraburkholderia sp. HD33-4]|uniref:hypothetical protein n=1 Tax=Paraburkholderia sp. HD33-4 TaxID=2883242 RepID=UPI001F4818CE|nr:hypothetical protein [Paraburkholderia sp. HD33-4]
MARKVKGATAGKILPEESDASALSDLRDLVSFQLRQLTNIYTKGSSSEYERNFGLTMNEWRCIALLHGKRGQLWVREIVPTSAPFPSTGGTECPFRSDTCPWNSIGSTGSNWSSRLIWTPPGLPD